jgi:hypothetical protein
MPFSTTADNQMLDALNGGTPSSIIAFASLHTAYSTSGANELTGGSPAYARIQLGTSGADWSAAGSSIKLLGTAPAAFNVPASTTVAYIGFWSTLTAGTFAGMGPNAAGTQFAFTAASGATATFTAPGSSFTNGQTVVVFPGVGATLPTTLPTAGTVYFIVSVSGATFQLSTTSGGAGITTGSTGSGLIQTITTEAFAGQGTFQLTTATALSVL